MPDSTPRAGAESAMLAGHVSGKRTDRRTFYTPGRVSWCRSPTASQHQRKSRWDNREFHLRPLSRMGYRTSKQIGHREVQFFGAASPNRQLK